MIVLGVFSDKQECEPVWIARVSCVSMHESGSQQMNEFKRQLQLSKHYAEHNPPPPRLIFSHNPFSNAFCSFNVASPPIPGPPGPTPKSATSPVPGAV